MSVTARGLNCDWLRVGVRNPRTEHLYQFYGSVPQGFLENKCDHMLSSETFRALYACHKTPC